MKIVHYAETPAEAHMVRGYLAECGVHAIVQGEALGGARGELPMSLETAPTVCVADGDAQRAFDLLEARRRKMAGGSDGGDGDEGSGVDDEETVSDT